MNVCETLMELAAKGIDVQFTYHDRALNIHFTKKLANGNDLFSWMAIGEPMIYKGATDTDLILAGMLRRVGDELHQHNQ